MREKISEFNHWQLRLFCEIGENYAFQEGNLVWMFLTRFCVLQAMAGDDPDVRPFFEAEQADDEENKENQQPCSYKVARKKQVGRVVVSHIIQKPTNHCEPWDTGLSYMC